MRKRCLDRSRAYDSKSMDAKLNRTKRVQLEPRTSIELAVKVKNIRLLMKLQKHMKHCATPILYMKQKDERPRRHRNLFKRFLIL